MAIGYRYDAITKKTEKIEASEPIESKPPSADPTEAEMLRAEVVALKARLAKIEAVPLIKTALEPIIIKDPIIGK